MPEELPKSKPESQVPASQRDLGWSFAVGLVIAAGTLVTAFALASLLSSLFPSPHHEVADAIVRIVFVDWALVAAELIAGIVVRSGIGRVAVGNALIIGALVSAAGLMFLGLLTGACGGWR